MDYFIQLTLVLNRRNYPLDDGVSSPDTRCWLSRSYLASSEGFSMHSISIVVIRSILLQIVVLAPLPHRSHSSRATAIMTSC